MNAGPLAAADGAMRFVDPVRGHGAYLRTSGTARPDIAVITIDMVPPEAWRDDGYRGVLRTPHLDALRRESVVFENAFSTSPLCGPSRAAFLTGRYSYLTVNEERAHDGMAYRLRPDDIIFPQYLRADGYVVRHTGKCHVGADKFIEAFGENAQPWDRWAPPIHDDDSYRAYLRSLGVNGFRFAREIRGLRQDGGTPGNLYGAWLEQEDGRPFPMEATYPHYLARRAANALREARRHAVHGAQALQPVQRSLERLRHTDLSRPAPVYLQLDFFAPHQPFMIPGGLEERERALRAAVRLPPSHYQAVQTGMGLLPGEPKIYGTYRRAHGMVREDAMRDYVVANLLQIEVLDAAIGVFLDALRAEGVYDGALILFFADHGEMNGERALVDKGAYCHPKVARVPLFLRAPGGRGGGRAVEGPVTLLDVAPTVLEAAGVRPLARLDGASLLPAASGDASPRERNFLFEAGWHLAPNPAVGLPHRCGDGRLFWYAWNLTSDADELYDLSDPTYTNRARDPALREVREGAILRLGAFLRADPRWRCYWHPFRIEFESLLEPESGDLQMFVPER